MMVMMTRDEGVSPKCVHHPTVKCVDKEGRSGCYALITKFSPRLDIDRGSFEAVVTSAGPSQLVVDRLG